MVEWEANKVIDDVCIFKTLLWMRFQGVRSLSFTSMEGILVHSLRALVLESIHPSSIRLGAFVQHASPTVLPCALREAFI